MTVQSELSRKSYDGNGVTTAFAVPFRFLDKTHLRVIRSVIATGVETELTLDSAGADGFTVTGAGEPSGGTVTAVTAPSTLQRITILRNVPLTQLLDFIANDAFPAESHEQALDQLTMIAQQQEERLDRAATLPEAVSGVSAELPTPEALRALRWNGARTALENYDPSAISVPSGSDQVGFQHGFTGAVARTVQDKGRDTVSAKDGGAVGDGVTNDEAALELVLANASDDIELPPGEYLVTDRPANPLGRPYRGRGRVVKAVPGGTRQLNTRAHDGQLIFGQENLHAFMAKLFQGLTTAKVVCSGDSTTAGDGTTAPWGFVQALAAASYDRGHHVSFTNSGHSGENTSEWVSTYLAADLALNPDLYVVRWGINDPFNGRTIAQFAADLDAGLTQCRAAKTIAQMAILIMVPNSTSDTPNGRDEKWYEDARDVCRELAEKHGCAYFDTYGLFQNSRDAAGLWMDDPFGDGRAIHPANIMNAWIASKLADLVFPHLLRPRIADGTNYSKTASSLPSTYPYGWSHFSTASGDTSFPMKNAHVLTFKSLNGVVMQWAHSGWASETSASNNGGLNKAQISARMGQHVGATDTWYAWSGHAPLDLTSLLVNGWVPFAANNNPSASMNGNVVTLSGLIKSGATAAGTDLLTLPAGWRPRNSVEVFLQPMGPTGTTTPCVVHINGIGAASPGLVEIQSVANVAFLSLSGISFEAG